MGIRILQMCTVLLALNVRAQQFESRAKAEAAKPLISGLHQFTFGLQYNYFSNPNLVDYSNSTDSQLGLDYTYHDQVVNSETSFTEKKLNFIFGMFPVKAINYFGAPEAFWSQKLSSEDQTTHIQFNVGRKHEELNQIDDRLNLGLFSPTFSQDNINFVKQGLIGFSSEFKKDFYKLNVGYYPIFLPSQGPTFKEQNGQLVFANRWGAKLPTYFVNGGQNKSIDYKLDSYNIYELASHEGYSLGGGLFNLKDHGFAFQYNYVNAPLNEMVISREVYADMNLNGHVVISPVVRYANKFSYDLMFAFGRSLIGGSYLLEKPRNGLEQNNYAVQTFKDIEAYSIFFDSPEWTVFDRDIKFSITYARLMGGEVTDLNPDGTENAFTVSKTRLRYKEPLRTDVKFDAGSISGRPIKSLISWTYDLDQKATLFSIATSFAITPKLKLGMSADILGMESETNSEVLKQANYTSYFIEQHRADDRISGELSYVF